jgi:hypothetical protein
MKYFLSAKRAKTIKNHHPIPLKSLKHDLSPVETLDFLSFSLTQKALTLAVPPCRQGPLTLERMVN